MAEPVLVIMAAGMGSRYGGLKQIDPVDDYGNLIIDFSIYDAIQAGFQKIIFVIKHEIEKEFKERIGSRIAALVSVEYVYQELEYIPAGCSAPEGRRKPWGTGHAVLCCKDCIDGPFAVINADDYYGKSAFQILYDALKASEEVSSRYFIIGYTLTNTLTENGHVARGICEVDTLGMLQGVKERTHIEKRDTDAAYTEDGGITWSILPASSIVSMNLWGFHRSILRELEAGFKEFYAKEVKTDPLTAEFFLPTAVGDLIKAKKAEVKVLQSQDKWYGVTYKEDKMRVVQAFRSLKEQGRYPERLWR